MYNKGVISVKSVLVLKDLKFEPIFVPDSPFEPELSLPSLNSFNQVEYMQLLQDFYDNPQNL